jgi:hypothetical protein
LVWVLSLFDRGRERSVLNDNRGTRKMLEEVEDKIEKKQLKFKLIVQVLKEAGVIHFFPTLFSFFINKI